ncbi:MULTISPECIES: glycosyltransferase family 4 protein [Spirosoma]|uniref:Glycosyltransferase family 1 protein n=1 Tax=Spirosoma sordidisoli TaxID=2502893 RepID=A0A4Q2USE5_9BACT|nr:MULTISPECIES: glycosyltransferase family 4 protein [Spirosoma]RYC70630.1 glycosyltransferase family 1 protein [Spirosoma sordidisoli]
MRILIVHNILWAHYKSSVFQALQRLIDLRPDSTLMVLQIARNERSRAGLEANQADAPTYTYPYELLFDRYLEEVGLQERSSALLNRARAFRPDVLLLTGYYDPAQLLLLLWAKATGVRVVMQNESTAADHQRGGWKEQLKRWILSRCDGFFCFGSQSATYLIQLGIAPHKILLRKNSVDNTALRTAYLQARQHRSAQQHSLGIRTRNFVFVGRLIAVKNLKALLNAFADAQAQAEHAADWGLILLGDGPEKSALLEQAATRGSSDAVHFLPGRPWYQVPDVLAISDVLVLPSLSEPWGLVVNEAMACGLPVIVSNRCGCAPDLVRHGENGFVFDPDQPDELTRHLLSFMNGTVDADQLGQSALAHIAPYAPEAVAQDMLDGFIKLTT